MLAIDAASSGSSPSPSSYIEISNVSAFESSDHFWRVFCKLVRSPIKTFLAFVSSDYSASYFVTASIPLK